MLGMEQEKSLYALGEEKSVITDRADKSPWVRRSQLSLLVVATAFGVLACQTTEGLGDSNPGSGASRNDGGASGNGGGSGADTGSGGQVNNAELEVLESSPKDYLLDGRSPIAIEFNQEIMVDEPELSVVLDTAINITGSVEAVGSTLYFRPDAPLSALGTYVVTVGGGVTSLAGKSLANDYSFSFESLNGEERPSATQRLDLEGSGKIECPHMAADRKGNVMVLYERDGALFTAYYRAGVGWNKAKKLANGDSGVLAMSPGGRAAVSYKANVSGTPRMLVSVTDLGNDQFSSPLLADEGSIRSINVSGDCTLGEQDNGVAVNDDGALAVTWRGVTATSGDYFNAMVTNVRPTGSDFQTPVNTGTYPSFTPTERPTIAIDSLGNVELLFGDFTGGGDSAVRRSYNATTETWSAVSAMPGDSSSDFMAVSVNADDRFTFLYTEYDYPNGVGRVKAQTQGFGSTAPNNEIFTSNSSGSPTQLYLNALFNPWIAWLNDNQIRINGYLNSPEGWHYVSTSLTDDNAQWPVVAAIEDPADTGMAAIVAWESDDSIRWARSGIQNGFPPDLVIAGGPYTLPSGGGIIRDPRITYDLPGRHGILLYTWGDGLELRATSFHRLPPAESP